MNDDRGTSIAEDGMVVIAKSDVRVLRFEFCLAVGTHGEIGIVTGVMTLRVLQPMLFAVRVEVWTRRLEVLCGANGILMKVNGMFAGGQVLEIDFHLNTWLFFPQSKSPHTLSLGILESNDGLGDAQRWESCHEQ